MTDARRAADEGPDGSRIVEDLEAARAAGSDRAALLVEAVRRIESSSPRFDWVGVYLLEGDELVLGPYVGKPTEHDRIPVGQGVCGTAVAEDRNVNVADVREIDNYIACSLETRAELVVLIREPRTRRVVGQLDLDSDRVAAFADDDERELEVVATWLGTLWS